MTRRQLIKLPLAAAAGASRGEANAVAPDVARFADTLLDVSRSVPGPAKLWPGVIDTADFTIPQSDVPAPKGVRGNDRALGGCNLYHDVSTIRLFDALSDLTGDGRYRRAAVAYMEEFLSIAQSPETGLLAWGEHLYFHLFRREVDVARKWHEMLDETPPWPALWAIDAEAVQRAIAGIRFHFYSDKPGSLFNRHARWDLAEHQQPDGQPWIKHSALYAYSFYFLASKTGDRRWRHWARSAGAIYWDARNPATGLTPSCIGDPRPISTSASAQTLYWAYWLLQAAPYAGEERRELESRARDLAIRWARCARLDDGRGYWALVDLKGNPVGEELTPLWATDYGVFSLAMGGRIAAQIAKQLGDEASLELATHIADLASRHSPPTDASPEAVAHAMHLSLDLHALIGDEKRLAEARSLGAIARERFWQGSGERGLFVRANKDRYYEAKLRPGALASALLRLWLHAHGDEESIRRDWSF